MTERIECCCQHCGGHFFIDGVWESPAANMPDECPECGHVIRIASVWLDREFWVARAEEASSN